MASYNASGFSWNIISNYRMYIEVLLCMLLFQTISNDKKETIYSHASIQVEHMGDFDNYSSKCALYTIPVVNITY